MQVGADSGSGSMRFKARARLGAAPLKLLFDRVKGPTGTTATPGVFYAGRRVLTLDGFTLDLPDTSGNDDRFGRGGTAGGVPGPYPQLRAMALAEAGTHSLLGVVYGGYHRRRADPRCGQRHPRCAGPGHAAVARAEPKTLRYRIGHTAARLVRGQRKRKIKIPGTWAWAPELEACFLAAFALPPPP